MNLKSTTFSDSSQPQQLTDLMNPLTRHMWKVGFFEMENRAVVVKDWKWKWSCSVVSDSLRSHGPWPARLLHPWDSPGKSTGVGCHFLLQGIFPTHGLNLGLPDCRQMLYHLSHQGNPHQGLGLKKEFDNYWEFKVVVHWRREWQTTSVFLPWESHEQYEKAKW